MTGDEHMNYKAHIMEMLDMLDERRLRLVYFHIRGLLGLK